VFVPNSETFGISRRLPDAERQRLKDILKAVRPKGHGLIVRTAADQASESLIYAQYILKNTPNAKIGVIYQNDDYGQDYLDGLTKGLGSKAAEMIVDKESNDVGAPDLNSQILKLKNSGADTLFVFETPSPAIKALVSAFQNGWQQL